jgi:hypothetical protein
LADSPLDKAFANAGRHKKGGASPDAQRSTADAGSKCEQFEKRQNALGEGDMKSNDQGKGNAISDSVRDLLIERERVLSALSDAEISVAKQRKALAQIREKMWVLPEGAKMLSVSSEDRW